jgi:hypothetical protein
LLSFTEHRFSETFPKISTHTMACMLLKPRVHLAAERSVLEAGNKKRERRRKPMQKTKMLKSALTLAAMLAMAGTVWAAKGGGPGIAGVLSPQRDSATLQVPVSACTAVVGQSYAVSAYIFQPSGRLLSIGIGNGPITCNGLDQLVDVTVDAIQGLTFKPGPATLLYRVTVTDSSTTPATVTTVAESGSRVDLH